MSDVTLIPIAEEHCASTMRWANDPECMRAILRISPVTEADQAAWFKGVRDNPAKQVFAILKDGEHVGNTGFYNIDKDHGRAEFWILIGEKSARGAGLGTMVLRKMLDKGFGQLALNRIYLHVGATNAPAIRLYEKAGFQKEGTLRGHYLIENKRIDVMVMSMLRSEYGIQEPA